MKVMNVKKLFGIGVLISLGIALMLVNILPVYKMGIFMSTDTHQVVDTVFLYATILYFAFVLWFYIHHGFWIKLIVISLILFLSYFFGMTFNYRVLKPIVISIPALYAVIDNWEFNMDWFKAFSISIITIIVYYIEQYFFYWVRSDSKTQS
jgi:hypothetical protein